MTRICLLVISKQPMCKCVAIVGANSGVVVAVNEAVFAVLLEAVQLEAAFGVILYFSLIADEPIGAP